MKKIKFFSMLLVMLFTFTLSGIINANAETNYVFTAHSIGGATVNNNVVTMTSSKGMIVTDVSGVDLTGDVYISIRVEAPVKNLDIFANEYSESTRRLAYKVQDKKSSLGTVASDGTLLTEYAEHEKCTIITCKVDDRLTELGVTELTKVLVWLRGNSGDVVRILDFAITTDGVHGFGTEVPEIGEEPAPELPTEPVAVNGVTSSSEVATITTNENDEQVITYSTSPGWATFDLEVINWQAKYSKFKIEFTPSSDVEFFYKVNGVENWDIGYVTYKGGEKATQFIDLIGLPQTFKVSIIIDANQTVDVEKSIIIHNAKAFDPTVYDETEPTVFGEITTAYPKVFTVTKVESDTVVKYSTHPDTKTIAFDVENLDPTATKFVFEFTPSETLQIGYLFNGSMDWGIGHKEYVGGQKYTEIVDCSGKNLPVYFAMSFYVDCPNANITSEKTLTIHSYGFYKEVEPEEPEIPEVYDPEAPTTYSELTSSKSELISTNGNGEQVVSYDATTAPGWNSFKLNVGNYNPEKTQLNIVYSATEDFIFCVNYNVDSSDKNHGHLTYFAATERTIKLDFSDTEKYPFGVNFQLTLFFDATAKDITAKSITIHSIEFVTPDPEPTEFTVFEPVGKDGIVCKPKADEAGKWVLTYTSAASWSNVEYTIFKHDASYDIISFNLNVPANTNLGVFVNYSLNGSDGEIRLRNHDHADALVTAGGNNQFVYWLAAYGLEEATIKSVKLYFDNPTSVTVNEGAQTAVINSFEFLKSSELTLGDLEYSLEDTVVDYTGEEPELDVVCNLEGATFKYQHALVVEGEELQWSDGIPANAGEYVVRIIYMGSLEHAYKVVTGNVTINKVKATVNVDDITVDEITRVVTVKSGIEASTSAEFAEGSTIYNGDVVEYGTVIYYRHKDDRNYYASDVLSLTLVKPLEVYIMEAKAELSEYKDAEDYREAQQAELAAAIEAGNAAIDEAATIDEVAEALAAAKVVIDAIKTDEQLTAEEAAALAAAKAEAKEALASYKSADLYREAEQTALAAAIEAGNTAIDVAATVEAVSTELAAAKAVIDGLKLKATYEAEELAAAKLAAKAQLVEYKSADIYRAEQKAELAAAIEAGKTAIDAAVTVDAVNEALAAAKAVIDDIKTDVQLTAEELAAAKAEAIKTVVKEIGTYNINKDAYEAAINAAATIDAVAEELADALADIANKQALIDRKAAAKVELATYKDAADYREEQQVELAAAITAGNTAIDAAATIDEVNAKLMSAKQVIDAIKTDAELDYEESLAEEERALLQAKSEAKKALASYKSADLYRTAEQEALAAAIAAGNTVIDAAENEDEVAEALAAAKVVIDGLKLKATYEAEELAAAKVTAKESLASYKSADLYREAEQTALAAAIAAGNTAIDAATTEAKVTEELKAAKAVIDGLKLKATYEAEELAAAKSDAKTALESYKNAADYRDAEKALLAEAIIDGKLAIDTASTIAAVESALAGAKAEIDALKTDAQLTAEELAAAKLSAIADVVKAIGTYSIDQKVYETAINAATTKDAVAEVLATSLTEITSKKAVIDAKATAKAELASYKSADLYREAEQTALAAAITAGNAAIDVAATVEAVSTELAAAKAVIDGLKLKATYEAEELAAAKVAAKAELAAYKSADLYKEAERTQLTTAISNGNVAIDAATTEAKVAEELAAAKEVIDGIKTKVDYEAEAAQALAQAKTDAKAALASYKSADLYREAEQSQLAAAIAAGNTAIDAASSEELVAFALTTAKAKIDALKTKAQYEAEEEAAAKELAKAKTDAKAALASYKSADLYREAEQAKLTEAITAGNTAIDAAASKSEVSQALATAKATIDTFKTKAVYEAEEKQAAEALAKAKADAIAEIAKEIGTYSIDKAEYEAKINAAKSIEEVASALAAAKTDIAAKKVAIDKENEKEPEEPTEEPKKGCKGAIVPSILSVIALLGVCFTFRRKEQE